MYFPYYFNKMDNEDYYESSGINNQEKGEEKELEYLDEYMLSTIYSIKEDFLMKFPSEISDFYIHTKYNNKQRIFKIFVTLLRESKINSRDSNINFLLTINEKFPESPPMVFCLSDVNQFNK